MGRKKKTIMVYTEGEICEMYRSAKDKEKQLQYLADLNVASVDEIVDILHRNGYFVPGFKKKEKSETLTTAVRNRIASSEFAEKSSDSKNETPKIIENPVLQYMPPDVVWALVEKRIMELNELTEHCRRTIEECTEEFGRLYEFQVAYGKAGEKISQLSANSNRHGGNDGSKEAT